MILKKKIGIVVLASVLSIMIGACIVLFGDLFSNEESGSVGTGENGSSNGNGSTISTEGYEDFYGTYSRDYVYPYGGEIKISLYENGQYEIYEMYIQTNGYYRQVTETGTYTKTVGFDDEDILIVWIFTFNPTTSSGIRNGEYFTLNMGYYTENLWKDRVFFYGQKKDSNNANLYMGDDTGFFALEYVVYRYDLSYTAGAGGSIIGEVSQTVEKGANGSSVTAVADDGYEFVQWSDGVQMATRQDLNVQGNISVTAQFRDISPVYSLFYGADVGGSIVGNIEQAVKKGKSGSSVTAVADNGYEFVQWSDGVQTATRQDSNVQENISVTAQFRVFYQYSVTVQSGLGQVSVSANRANATNGFTVSATAVADDGWGFYGWSDGVKTATRTDVLTNDFHVEAIFGREVTLIVSGGGGRISHNGQQGQRITVLVTEDDWGDEYPRAIADDGYICWGWFISESASTPWKFGESIYLDYYDSRTVYYVKFIRLDD